MGHVRLHVTSELRYVLYPVHIFVNKDMSKMVNSDSHLQTLVLSPKDRGLIATIVSLRSENFRIVSFPLGACLAREINLTAMGSFEIITSSTNLFRIISKLYL